MKDITDTVNDVCNVLHDADCCSATKWVTIMSERTGQSPVQTVPACPVQIRAHHHIDVCTDINNETAAMESHYLFVGNECNEELHCCPIT